jgi:hypothetical protein
VLVAPGAGPHLELAIEIAEAIVDADPRATVRLAGGFLGAPARIGERTVGPARTVRQQLASASVAVAGVSMNEADALGTPAPGVPVVAAERPTFAESVTRDAAGGSARGSVSATDVAEECVSLLSDAALRRRLSVADRRLI